MVCSLKCFGNDLICWLFTSVKATKPLPCVPFQPTGGKSLAVCTFWDMNFPPKLPSNLDITAGNYLVTKVLKGCPDKDLGVPKCNGTVFSFHP